MGQYVDFYCENENKELKKIVNPILMRRFAWIPQKDYDDFYSIASMVVWDCEQKFDGKKVKTKKFKSFVSTCIHNKIKTHITYMNRDKRMAKDEEGNPLHNSSLDAPIDDDGLTIGDYLYSAYDLEKEVIEKEYNEDIQMCLDTLPKIDKQIIEMLIEDMPLNFIKEKLKLSDSQYNKHMKSIRENRLIIDFKTRRNNKRTRKAEAKIMNKIVSEEIIEEVIEVMDIDTTNSYRRDNNTLGSLLDDISDELSPTYINRDYISQRQPFMWNEEQINKFYTRILNNQPIPEIVICEQMIDGEKISFLIDGLQRLSYAELFKNNARVIGVKGAEFTHIRYKKRVMDEDGNIKVIEEIFNVIGKKYEDLPEFLQKRFDNFNISVIRFFNCTSKMIDYHIRNYNSHTSMNKVQYGATNASNITVGNIKSLSQKHPFFKDIVKTNNSNIKDGSWDEVVARAIMATHFLEDWKKEIKDVFIYLDEHSNKEQFECLKKCLDNLTKAIGNNSLKELFTTGNTHVWLAVYEKFTKLGLEDDKFVNFMKKFKNDLCEEEMNDFIKDVYKSRSTRDKKIVSAKIEGLYELMKEFLHIKKEDLEDVDTLEFVKENADPSATDEEIELYEMMLDDCVKVGNPIYKPENMPSLLALIAYGVKENKDKEVCDWLTKYAKNTTTYIAMQKQNYLHMLNLLQKGAIG